MERTSLKLAGAKLILITGGARSGKSAFAEKYAAQAAGKDGKVAYIATARVYDEEMKFRVQRHRARRPENWQTFEAPTEEDVLAALQQAGETCDVILFDCLTLFLSNFLCSLSEEELREENRLYQQAEQTGERLLETASQMTCTRALVMVTNEVGEGIVPQNHLARVYRDLAGLLSQQLALVAEAVYLVSCGQAVNLKSLALSPEEAVRRDLGDFERCLI